MTGGGGVLPSQPGPPAVARADFGQLIPVAAPHRIPPPARRWTADEWARINRGHKSADMDDRWHAFVEDQRLYLHRSWTGHGIYEARFDQSEGWWRITDVVVNGDRDVYRRFDDAAETDQLERLIVTQLLTDW